MLRDGDDLVLVASGSEVSLALETADRLDRSVRVVSLPCWEAFARQEAAYQEAVLGVGIPRVSIEAAATFGWERIVGAGGLKVGIDRFGVSAPAAKVAEHLGFTPDDIAARINDWMDSAPEKR